MSRCLLRVRGRVFQKHSLRPAGILLLLSVMPAGCTGMLVNARESTLSGASMTCRISQDRPSPNHLRLKVEVKPPCTTDWSELAVLSHGQPLTEIIRQKIPVLFQNEVASLDSNAFAPPPAGTILTVHVQAECTANARKTDGVTTCEMP